MTVERQETLYNRIGLVDIPFPLSDSTEPTMWLRVPRGGLSDADATRLQEMIWSLVIDKAVGDELVDALTEDNDG